MSNTSLRYPATPANVDPQILQPSSAFKKEATKVLGAILFFILTYIVLFAAALCLAALCAVGGLGLIALKPMAITIMLGLGLAGLGIMVVVFLVKFLFKRHKVDRSGLIEITAQQHPKLFEFIRTLSKETQTSLPKKIYLSPDVNACVFYDSSFWSMFLPVKKNLQIGLGLVNAMNVSEFKAVVAHEFGHFSQRSMKLGSYVYNMNHIIFNMLYDNEGYQDALGSWANSSGYFAFFAGLTAHIVKGIQWILQQVYAIMNKIYMGLSRQMEFHADTVAASVSGGNHLVTALRRLETAEVSYNNVFGFYEENFKKGLKPENVYLQQREVMRHYGEYYGLAFEHGLPLVEAASFTRFNKSRVLIKDQWASHPSTDDREKHLRSLKIETAPQHDSAWTLFNDAKKLQEEITEKIFSPVKYEVPVQTVNEVSFYTQYRENAQRYQLPAIYKGFFDNRYISKTDLRDLEMQVTADGEEIDKVMTDEMLALPHNIAGLKQDIQVLEAIVNNNLKVKNFEFDGKKLKATEASALRNQLEKELNETEKMLVDADRKLIAWFLIKANGHKELLREKYSELFILTESSNNDTDIYIAMQGCMMPMYQVMQFADIEKAVSKLKEQEVAFRERLTRILHDPSNAEFISDEQRSTATEYLSKEWDYFRAQTYIQQSIDRLNQCLYLYSNVVSEKAFKAKLTVLTLQLELAGVSEVAQL